MKKKEVKFAFVDDEAEMNLELAEAILKKKGYSNIDMFKTGVDFLNHYENKDITAPDLVFLDLKLPKIDGIKVLELACQKEKFSGTIFVALSNYIPFEHEEWLADSSFHDVLIKPINEKKLLEKIETLIVKRDKTNADRIPCKKPDAKQQQVTKLKVEKEELIKDYIEKLISPEVFEKLESDSERENLKPTDQEIAIAFLDVRGFTTINNRLNNTKKMSKILELLSDFVCQCITNRGGFIDKFIGDSVMWFHKDGSIMNISRRCIDVAIDIIKGMNAINEKIWAAIHRKVQIKVGIGIACGKVAVGIFGAPNYRIQYSVLGPEVNLASRLCNIAKGNEIIIGNEIIDYCRYDTEDMGFRKFKGFKDKIEVKKIIIPG